ncbi:hypothetical protein CBM2605_A140104 [Cupriavidus neocaledonicus]|uniref:Uncharacterized protein n=1 Tax=Cupriavidus neocaledonicus TaxID=1040979 RepID=A0ABY1UXK9_9BURK|nr:hypothetical protein CBM2605_A140104 [Cupriavidus neocaledonicus]
MLGTASQARLETNQCAGRARDSSHMGPIPSVRSNHVIEYDAFSSSSRFSRWAVGIRGRGPLRHVRARRRSPLRHRQCGRQAGGRGRADAWRFNWWTEAEGRCAPDAGKAYLQQVIGPLRMLAAVPLHRPRDRRRQRLRVCSPPTFARQIIAPGACLSDRRAAARAGFVPIPSHRIAYPPHLAGGLISEAARSAGAMLINGEG